MARFPAEALEPRALLTIAFEAPSILGLAITQPTSVALIDADADGDLDLVTGGDSLVAVYLNNGNGLFSAPFDIDLGQPVLDLIRGDFEGDGPDDLYIRFDNGGVISDPLAGVASFGAGTPPTRSVSGIAAPAATFAVGDFDNNNADDIASYDMTSGEIVLFLNNGSGFGSSPARIAAEPSGQTLTALFAGDFDGDGIDDLGALFNGLIRTFTGPFNGGAFGPSFDLSPGFSGAAGVAVGDFNGDGNDDIVVRDTTAGFHAALANGTGSFAAPSPISLGSFAGGVRVAAGDLNNDGFDDIVVSTTDSGLVGLTSAGASFRAPVALDGLAEGAVPVAVSLGDFDGDGDDDVVSATLNSATDAVAWRSLRGPLIGSFGTSRTSAGQGDVARLSASNVGADPLRSIERVTFGYDANSNGVIDSGEVLTVDTVGDDGYQFDFTIPSSIPAGSATFLAVARDSEGLEGPAVPLSIGILYSLFSEPTAELSGAADATGLTTVAALNSQGALIAYAEDVTGGWTARDLSSLAGSPEFTNDPAIFFSQVTGQTHIAATTADALWLFTRDAQGVWTALALTEQLATSRPIASGLTVFAYALGGAPAVTVAGLDAGGSVVAFTHATNTAVPEPVWSFRDLSAEVLANTGATTPTFVGPLVSYVTSWGGLNIAGRDSAGDIHTVWTGASDGPWFTSNLTDITGAPAYEGEVTAYVTSWGGINIAGLDADGNILVTWWVPQFGGDWEISDLTALFSGPAFEPGGITSYVTPWGGLNVAGVRDDGELVIYWWVPEFEGTWVVSPISTQFGEEDPRPTGPLSSYASPIGTLNVFGASADGELARYSWNPGDGGDWTSEDLTSISARG